MAFKLMCLLAFVAASSASVAPLLHYAHAPAPVVHQIIEEPSAPAHYDYGYAVNDPLTGDSKSQHESRRGDVVHGSYSLVDPDGTRRTVNYAADPVNGFNAVVSKEPIAVAVRTVVAPAPVTRLVHHSPISYAAPHYYR